MYPFSNYQPNPDHTFENAARSYVRQGGSPRHLEAIIDYFQGREVTSIVPAKIREMALPLDRKS